MDRSGGAVACSLTNNNLFGTGRVAALTGIVLARSPETTPQPMLSAAIVTRRKQVRAALASSGQNDAADALANSVRAVSGGATPAPETAQGRVNLSRCDGQACIAQTDPRGLAWRSARPRQRRRDAANKSLKFSLRLNFFVRILF
ncbi:hypothetical protein CGLAMM_10185 [Acetobacteraceae bacterium EV16G]